MTHSLFHWLSLSLFLPSKKCQQPSACAVKRKTRHQGQVCRPVKVNYPSLSFPFSLSSAADILWSRMQSGQPAGWLAFIIKPAFPFEQLTRTYLPRKFQQMVGIFYLPSVRFILPTYLNPTIAAANVLDQCRGNGGGCGRVEE